MAKNDFETNGKNAQDAKNTKGKDKQEQNKYTDTKNSTSKNSTGKDCRDSNQSNLKKVKKQGHQSESGAPVVVHILTLRCSHFTMIA